MMRGACTEYRVAEALPRRSHPRERDMTNFAVGYKRQGSVAVLLRNAGRLAATALCLPVFMLLRTCEPVVRIGMKTLATLGILTSLVLALSGAAPRIPLMGALAFFVGCGFVPWLFRSAMRLIEP